MTTGSDVTSCSYRCPCEDNQCRVVVDDEEQFKEQPTNICEITYELEEWKKRELQTSCLVITPFHLIRTMCETRDQIGPLAFLLS